MASLSAEAGVPSVTASSEASTSSPLQDAATTTASSQQQHTGESGANRAEFKDLRAILHRTKCRRHRKLNCRQARSDDDDFFGEVKFSTASSNITSFRPRAASPSAKAGVPLVIASSQASTWWSLQDAATTAASSQQQQTGETLPSAEAAVPLVTASLEASTSSPLQDASTTTASSQQQQTSESGRNQAECKDLRAKVHRTKRRRRRKPKCRQARGDDDDFFGEVKSSTASANITAFRPRAASPSAEAGVPLVTASSEASTSSPLQDAATTTASSQQQQTGETLPSAEAAVPLVTASLEASTSSPLQDAATTTAFSQQQQTSESGRNQAECKDLRAKVHRTKRRRRRKPKCRQARGDDDDFFGEVKSSTASANITPFRPRAASLSAEAGVPLVTASSEAFTSSPLQDAATTTASSQQQQTGES
ncbi:hypothetical protein MRX96_027491 [Rhipicephalus microplus]